MGRYARTTGPNLIYHIVNRGNDKQIVFKEKEDFRHYLNTIQRYKKKYEFKLFAFCLMRNHVHLAVKTSHNGNISKIMQSITVAHTRYYNFKYKKCGHVWQGRFVSPIVSEDEYFLNVLRYIEQNPVRAGLVKKAEDYPWSSYKLNIRDEESTLVDRNDNTIFYQLAKTHSGRIKEYKKLINGSLTDEDIKKINQSTRTGMNYISDYLKNVIKNSKRQESKML